MASIMVITMTNKRNLPYPRSNRRGRCFSSYTERTNAPRCACCRHGLHHGSTKHCFRIQDTSLTAFGCVFYNVYTCRNMLIFANLSVHLPSMINIGIVYSLSLKNIMNCCLWQCSPPMASTVPSWCAVYHVCAQSSPGGCSSALAGSVFSLVGAIHHLRAPSTPGVCCPPLVSAVLPLWAQSTPGGHSSPLVSEFIQFVAARFPPAHWERAQ